MYGTTMNLVLAAAMILVSLEPDDKAIHEAYTESYKYEKMGAYEDAVKALMPVYEAFPQTYTVNLRLGWLFYLKGNYANAISHYEKAQRSIPGSIEARLGRALPLMAQEKWKDVENLMYDVISVDYFNYYGNLRLAVALRMQKKYDNARKTAAKMLALYPTDTAFMTELALDAEGMGDLEKSRALFSNILILDPGNVTARTHLEKPSNPPEEGDKIKVAGDT